MRQTIELRDLCVVAVGGGVVGESGRHTNQFRLVCPACRSQYPMADEPRGLALGPEGATVLTGYVEMCPRCYREQAAGALLEVIT